MNLVLPCNMDPDKMSERELRNEVKRLRDCDKQRRESDHYGPYGPVCQNIGQFDAGECYICYAKRKREVAKAREREVVNLTIRAQTLMEDAKKYKAHAGEMQLVAGRYQYQFEHAMKALNSIDDVFEYAYEKMTPDQLRVIVRTALAKFTDAVKPKGK